MWTCSGWVGSRIQARYPVSGLGGLHKMLQAGRGGTYRSVGWVGDMVSIRETGRGVLKNHDSEGNEPGSQPTPQTQPITMDFLCKPPSSGGLRVHTPYGLRCGLNPLGSGRVFRQSTPPVDWGVDYTHLVVDRFFASPPTLWTGKPFNFVALRAQSIGHPLPPTVNPHSSRQNPWSMAS